MEWWIIFIVFGIPLILKMKRNWKENKAISGIIRGLERHSPEELAEIVEWEETLRWKMAELKILSDRGELTHSEFIFGCEVLLEKHREIEEKYNVTQEEMFEYYQNSRNVPALGLK